MLLHQSHMKRFFEKRALDS
uniref:BLTX335 n=1 Tax=Nephila pilipes TaxID=299642 RepID=A0A076KZE0_NEPPI|nr:BLTX335 [Nephila pilipes]AII97767.1 BLTX388 [Nephila pilipes]AII97788.1 BLTX413 [Nephila pilipes]AII97808.1 BLTX436 [Nephila pilipes]AII97845.1 BLTX474 [Nephila pilipes]